MRPSLGHPTLPKASIDSKQKLRTPQSFGLTVSSLFGTVITVQACRTDSCSSVQHQVADKLDVQPYRVTISSDNGILKGKKTLEECAILHGSELFYVIGEADKWREMARDAFVELVVSRGLATRAIYAQSAKFGNYKMRQRYIPCLDSIEREEERKRLREEHRRHLQQSLVSEAKAMVLDLGVSGAANAIRGKLVDAEMRCNTRVSECQIMKEDAQRHLDEALPSFVAGLRALQSLTKKDIAEIKAFAKPPPLVASVGEAICALFEVVSTWDATNKLLNDPHILVKMIDYDKDNVSPTIIRSLDAYVQLPDFSPDVIARQSRAPQGMCMWVRAIHTYDRVAKVVLPKKERLMKAEDNLKDATLELDIWRNQLAELST